VSENRIETIASERKKRVVDTTIFFIRWCSNLTCRKVILSWGRNWTQRRLCNQVTFQM